MQYLTPVASDSLCKSSGHSHNTLSDKDGVRYCEFCNHELYLGAYVPRPGQLFSRRSVIFRCLFIDDISILFENQDGERYLDTSSDEFEPANAWSADENDGDECESPGGHSWVTQSGDEISGEGRCYCEYCGADGDA